MRASAILVGVLASLATVSCGDDAVHSPPDLSVQQADGDDTEYGANTNVVVTEDGTYVVTGDPAGQCVEIDGQCVEIDQSRDHYCDDPDAQADFVLVEGVVVDVVCYPPPDSGVDVEEVLVTDDGTAEIPQNQGGAVITFSEQTDGEPLVGDVTVDAERTVIFGNGVDETVIEGDLTVASNNSRVRGLTVTGDVQYTQNANGSAMTFCRVHGSLRAESNSFTLLACDVFGDVTVEGNGAVLSDVGVAGEWNVAARSTCSGCFSFADEDHDFVVDDDEVGDAIACGQR